MELVRDYVLSVVAAAIISTLALTVTNKNRTYSSVIRLLVGVFLSVTIVAPLAKIKFHEVSMQLNSISDSGREYVTKGCAISHSATADIISEQVAEYVLNKAEELGISVDVSVIMSNENELKPQSIHIRGTTTPYAKAKLENILENELEIAEENQIWN